MFPHSLQNSNYPSENGFSSSKKKATTPALLFFKSQKDPASKHLSENNSALFNTNRSPMRTSNVKNTSLISRSPLLNKSNISTSDNKPTGGPMFNKSRRVDQYHQETSMLESVHYCENHEDKSATFMSCVEEGDIMYFCDKCAILLATQGYTVEKINDSEGIVQCSKMQGSRSILKGSTVSQKSCRSNVLSNSRSMQQSSNSRRVEIQNFLSMTKNLLQQIEYKKEQIKQNLINSQEFYGQQIQEVNQYFELVYKSLELEKNKCYNYILNQRIEVERPVRLINDTISELKDKIQGIIEDIEENIETVFQTTDEIYRPVIEQYQENYHDISRRIAQINVLEVEMRKVDFQGVPESIFCISDILKESIGQNYQHQHQAHMSHQLHSLKQSLRQSLPQLEPRKLFTKKEEAFSELQSKASNKFCFSFEGEALQAQLEQEKVFLGNEE